MYQGIGADIAAVMAEANASGLYVSLIQFQTPTGFGASRAPSGSYVNVPGLVDLFTGSSAIGCMDAPLAPGTISALESKSLTEIESQGIRHVSLNGYYPQVIENWSSEQENMNWRAIVDGVAYEVFSVEADSQTTQTRVKLRLVLV
jgi:predicted butyrate kinase (DUF1464 family)